MKNMISENYNLFPEKIYKKGNEIYFFVNDDKYVMREYVKKSGIDELLQLSNEMYKKTKGNSSVLVPGVGNNYVYEYKRKKYILMKVNSIERNILLDDIIYLTRSKSDNDSTTKNLEKYKKQIDDIETKLLEFNKEYPKIQQSIDYFIGLSENGIQLLGKLNREEKNQNEGTIIAKIENIDEYNNEELNNPLNMEKNDYELALANYIKYRIYLLHVDYDEMENIFRNDKINHLKLYAYLLYQNYYLSDIVKITRNKEEEKIIKKYIDNRKKYSDFLLYYAEKAKINMK